MLSGQDTELLAKPQGTRIHLASDITRDNFHHPFINYFLSTNGVLDNILSPGNAKVNKTEKSSGNLHLLFGKQTVKS